MTNYSRHHPRTEDLPGVRQNTLGFLTVEVDGTEYWNLNKRPYQNGVVLARHSAWANNDQGIITEVYALRHSEAAGWQVIGQWHGKYHRSNTPEASTYNNWVWALKRVIYS